MPLAVLVAIPELSSALLRNLTYELESFHNTALISTSLPFQENLLHMQTNLSLRLSGDLYQITIPQELSMIYPGPPLNRLNAALNIDNSEIFSEKGFIY